MVTMIVSFPAFSRLNGRSIGSIAHGPMATVQNITHRLNTKTFGLSNILYLFAIGAASDKVSRHYARDFGQAMSLLSSGSQSALCNFVGAVVGWRSEPKMIRVHARRSVALMQHMKIFGFSMVCAVRKSVRENSSVAARLLKYAVSSVIYGGAPHPASAHGVVMNMPHKAVNLFHMITLSTRLACVK